MDTIANPKQTAYVGSLRAQGEESADLWFTPKWFIDAVRLALSEIDLDPFSCAAANEYVRAKKIFSKDDNAFTQDWTSGAVFMNPPYSRGLCAKACAKFADEWRKKRFNRGIVLINNMTDTLWFHDLVDDCAAICLLKGRIAFETLDAKRVSGNTRGQLALLFCRKHSPYVGQFKMAMNEYGHIFVNGDRR